MKYEVELQNLLERYLKAGEKGLPSNVVDPTSDLNEELYFLGYIKKQGFVLSNGYTDSGLGISEKGKRFLKNGGFKRQALIKLITRIGAIIVFAVTVLTFCITLNDCTNKGKATLKKQSTELCQVCTLDDCHCPHPKASDKP